MDLRFLIGPAGAGKTRACLREIAALLAEGPAAGGEALYFLVPEQATFQMERALLEADPRVTAAWRARVVSFKRLAQLALDEVGPATRPLVGELGRLLALQVAVQEVRPHLRVYRSAADTEGFLETLSATLSELRAYGHTYEALERTAALLEEAGGAAATALKLREIALLGRAYEGVLAGRFRDPDEALSLAVAAVPASARFRGARVWIDGFAGFTPVEYSLLAALMRTCRAMTVALCLDPAALDGAGVEHVDEGPEDALFHPTRATLVRLRQVARSAGVARITAEFLPAPGSPDRAGAGVMPRFRHSPVLARLERALANPGGRPPAEAGKGGSPHPGGRGSSGPDCVVCEAPNPAAEVEAAAREIRRLVRDEEYRYREIAVILRDLERYRAAIETTFEAWEIPFFLDYKSPAYYHPLVTLVGGALDLVRSGFGTEPLMRCLKTDLAGLSREQVDTLENEALALGVDGEAWLDDACWSASVHEPVRRAALGPFARFAAEVGRATRAGGGAREYLAALTGLLDELGAAGRLEAWARRAAEQGDALEAQEHVQVWSGLVEIMQQIEAVMGGRPLTFDAFAAALEAGLRRLRLGRVPPRLDQVLVGSVERSRQPDLRCALLLGLNEGHFPAVPAEDPIFPDDERERLRGAGLEVGPASRERLLHEQYLMYVALTRAGRRLFLTYARSDDDGRPLRPSAPVRWILERFPEVPLVRLPARPAGALPPERLEALPGWLARTCRDLAAGGGDRRPAGEALAAYQWLVAKGGGLGERAIGADPLASLAYRNVSDPLEPETAASLYGAEIVSSPSRLEEYAACAFRHFAGYGLRLAERARPRVDAALVGSLVHAALSEFVRGLQRDGRDWGELAREESDRRAEHAARRALERRAEVRAAREAERYVLRRVVAMLRAVVWALGEHCRSGRFRPYAVEVSFGPEGPLPGLVVETPAGRPLTLVGRIDRLDTAAEGGRRWVRVIDYKSSRRRLPLFRVVHGLDLQLVLYLAAAAAGPGGERLEPAGALYLPVHDPLLSVEHPPPEEHEGWRRELKAAGLIVAEDGVPRLMDAASTGHSDLLPLFFRKDGSLGSGSSAVTREQLQLLMEAARATAGRLAAEWAAGRTAIDPYELSQEIPCTRCPYRPVCQFDVTLPGNAYRTIVPERDEELWARLAAWAASRRRIDPGAADLVGDDTVAAARDEGGDGQGERGDGRGERR